MTVEIILIFLFMLLAVGFIYLYLAEKELREVKHIINGSNPTVTPAHKIDYSSGTDSKVMRWENPITPEQKAEKDIIKKLNENSKNQNR
jgi:hypothetical protein